MVILLLLLICILFTSCGTKTPDIILLTEDYVWSVATDKPTNDLACVNYPACAGLYSYIQDLTPEISPEYCEIEIHEKDNTGIFIIRDTDSGSPVLVYDYTVADDGTFSYLSCKYVDFINYDFKERLGPTENSDEENNAAKG